jgi:hypothetical protein
MQEGDSGWRLTKISSLEIRAGVYKPPLMRGRKYIKTPDYLGER